MDVKKLLFGSALAIILALFLGYAQSTFYPSPKYEDYCQQRQSRPLYNETDCLAEGGQWNEAPCVEKECPGGYCYVEFTCQQNYQDAQEDHGKKAFSALLLISILALIGGVVFKGVVGQGIMGGSILTIVYASMRYWPHIGDIFRLVLLGAALAILIWTGYKRFSSNP